jgi:hypothetical protein
MGILPSNVTRNRVKNLKKRHFSTFWHFLGFPGELLQGAIYIKIQFLPQKWSKNTCFLLSVWCCKIIMVGFKKPCAQTVNRTGDV